MFEIGELSQDYELDREDSRVMYYLGFDHLAALEAANKMEAGEVSDEVKRGHLEKAIFFLKERSREDILQRSAVDMNTGGGNGKSRPNAMTDVPNYDMSYACLQYLGIINWVFMKNAGGAESWYKKCIDFDDGYFRCHLSLSQLYADTSRWKESWAIAMVALEKGKDAHSGGDSGSAGGGQFRAINHEISIVCELPLHIVRLADVVIGLGEAVVEDTVGREMNNGIAGALERCIMAMEERSDEIQAA